MPFALALRRTTYCDLAVCVVVMVKNDSAHINMLAAQRFTYLFAHNDPRSSADSNVVAPLLRALLCIPLPRRTTDC